MDKEIFLRTKANHIRDEIMKVAIPNGAGHIAPSLSCVDILTALYYGSMSFDPKNPLRQDRDRLIFSKAHGCYGLYAILADIGVIPKEEWQNFYLEGKSVLCGCSERKKDFGLEAGCGSLGSIRRKNTRRFLLTFVPQKIRGSQYKVFYNFIPPSHNTPGFSPGMGKRPDSAPRGAGRKEPRALARGGSIKKLL